MAVCKRSFIYIYISNRSIYSSPGRLVNMKIFAVAFKSFALAGKKKYLHALSLILASLTSVIVFSACLNFHIKIFIFIQVFMSFNLYNDFSGISVLLYNYI